MSRRGNTDTRRQLYQNPLWVQIQERVMLEPHKVCMRETSGRSITYEEFVSRVDLVAEQLLRKGIVKGDRALFLARTSIDSVVYLLALLRAGGVVVVADPAMGREVFKSRVALAKPQWMILEPLLYLLQVLPWLGELLRRAGVRVPDTGTYKNAHRVVVRRPTGSAESYTEEVLPTHTDALIVFTSGTTSMPRGVVHTYASLLATLELIQADLHPKTSDVFYASQSYFILMAFLTGATAILPRETTFNPSQFMTHVSTSVCTKAFLLPAEAEELITYCRRTSRTLPECLKTIMLGSAPVLAGFLKRFKTILPKHTDVLCIYGATEIIPMARVSMEEKLEHKGHGDLLGKPFTQINVSIRDTEFVAQGPNLAQRYLDGEELQEYMTGDLGNIDDEGRLVLLGRKKDMIIKGNYNIYPSVFESIISTIPGVRTCALVGIYEEAHSDEKIVLVIEPEVSEQETELVARVKRLLISGPHSIDSYAQPDVILCMPIPLSGRSRKADKSLLREQLRDVV